MTDLNELFEQILCSERKFKARTDELRLVGIELEKCQSHIQETKEEVHTKLGELAVKRNKLADQEVETRILQIRKGILKEQRDSLSEAEQTINKIVDEAEKQYESDRGDFVDELRKFSQYYDLSGSGWKCREKDLQRERTLLQDELLLLEAESMEIRCQQEEVNKLESALSKAKNKLENANKELKELVNYEKHQKEAIQGLEQEKVMMDLSFCQEPDFMRLQKELESCKGSTSEILCKQLSKELDVLQRQFYHKQMKQQLARNSKNPQQPTANSKFCKSGHYNPYTLQYVPAPQQKNQSAVSISDKPDCMEVPNDHESDVGDDEVGWGMEVDEFDITFSDADFQESTSGKAEISNKKQLPPSNFHTTSRSSFKNTLGNDSMQACSFLSTSTTGNVEISSKMQPKEISSKMHPKINDTDTSIHTQRKWENRFTTSTLDSPEPQQVRKRQGVSIFKTAVTKDSDLPRRAKKVRFHYTN